MSHFAEAISTTLYFDRTFDCGAAKIGPGEYYFTNQDMVIVTVLGSCVSACIRDVKTGVGGMNHFMLPSNQFEDKAGPASKSMRYGSYAMEVLLNQLYKNGARRENLEAKIFGGGRVFPGMRLFNIGENNADFVRQFLKNENITVSAEDLQDIYPRKVYFFPKTGKVMVKKLRVMTNDTLLTREARYENQLKSETLSGDIDLF
jgi:chemotaxis protein CheD